MEQEKLLSAVFWLYWIQENENQKVDTGVQQSSLLYTCLIDGT